MNQDMHIFFHGLASEGKICACRTQLEVSTYNCVKQASGHRELRILKSYAFYQGSSTLGSSRTDTTWVMRSDTQGLVTLAKSVEI